MTHFVIIMLLFFSVLICFIWAIYFPVVNHLLFHFLLTLPTTIRDFIYFQSNKYFRNNELNINPNARHIIVLVHGRNSCPVQFVDIQEKLLTTIDSQTTLFPVWMKNGSSSIQTDGQSLYDQLSDYFGRQTHRDLTIIGISKGGVTACYASTVSDPIFSVKKIITLSSPLRGTLLAEWSFCSVTRQELSYQSDFVVDLEKEVKNKNVKIYPIVPQWDHLIIPIEASFYNHIPSTMIFKYKGWAGHIGIQYDPVVINQINRWIHEG